MKRILLFLMLLITIGANSQIIYTVTKTTDPDPFQYNYNFIDSLCDSTMYGTLQWALRKANDTPDSVLIQFNISGNGYRMININYTLPDITNKITIDGTTQQGYELNNPIIVISNGAFIVRANSCIIRGLYIRKNSYNGILCYNVNNVLIENNIINQINHTTMNLVTNEGAIALYSSQYCIVRNNIIGTDKDNNSLYYPGLTSSCKNGINIVTYPSPKARPSSYNEIINNKIANCEKNGIYIQTYCLYDKLSQNRIFNCSDNIRLLPGANNDKQIPEINSYNSFLLSGISSSNDVIEIFGGDSNNVYEFIETTLADENGNWYKRISTNYSSFIVTSTDERNNTSPFSNPFAIEPLLTQLSTVSCNQIDAALNQIIIADSVFEASKYLFKISDIETNLSDSIIKNNNAFLLNETNVPILFDHTYIINVKTEIREKWGVFGDTCQVKTVNTQNLYTCIKDTLTYKVKNKLTTPGPYKLTIQLENGISAFSSATVDNGGSITSIDTSSVSNPSYYINGTDSFTLNFIVKANCSMFNASDINYNSLVTIYNQGNQPLLTDTLFYIVKSPWIVYDSLHSEHINYTNNSCYTDPIVRTIKFKNTSYALNNGYFYFVDTIPSSIIHRSAFVFSSFTNSPSLTLLSSQVTAKKIIAKFKVLQIPHDSLVAINEIIYLDTIPTNTNKYSYFSAKYGCITDSVTPCAHTNVFPTQVNLDMTFSPVLKYQILNPSYDFCWRGGVTRYYIIKNIGHCPAKDVKILIPKQGGFPNITYIDTNSVDVSVDPSFNNILPYTWGYTNFSILQYYNKFRVYNIVLNPGDSLFMKANIYYNCPNATNEDNYFNTGVNINLVSDIPEVSFDWLTETYHDNPYHNWGITQAYYSLNQSFNNLTGVLMGDSTGNAPPVWFNINGSNLKLGGNYRLINKLDSSRFIVKLQVGEGLEFVDSIYLHSNILLQNIYPETTPIVTQNGAFTYVTAIFKFPSSFSSPDNYYDFVVEHLNPSFNQFFNDFDVRFRLKPVCPAPSNRIPIIEKTYYTPKFSCGESCYLPLSSVADSIFVTCPGCLLPGWNLSVFNIKRTNLGYKDNDNNNFPDNNPLQKADSTLANTSAIIKGDTILYTIKGFTSDGRVWLFNNIGFPFKYMQLKMSGPINNYLSFIDGHLTYYQNGDSSSVYIPHSALNNASGSYYFNLSFDSLQFYGLNTDFDSVRLGDNVVFNARFKVVKNLVNIEQPNTYKSTESSDAMLSMSGTPYLVPNVKVDANPLEPVFDTISSENRAKLTYFCTGWSGSIIAIGADFYKKNFLGHTYIHINNCYNMLEYFEVDNIGQKIDLANENNGFTVGNMNAWNTFDYEVRDLWKLDSVTITYPSAYFSVDSIFIYSTQLYKNSSGAFKMTDSLNKAPKVIYDLSKAHFSSNSVTFYPILYKDTINYYNHQFPCWGEVKRLKFNVLYKLNDCHSPYFEISGTDVATHNYFLSQPSYLKCYYSDFPASRTGDTIIQVEYNINNAHFTIPSTMISLDNVYSSYSNGLYNASLNFNLSDRLNSTNLSDDLPYPRTMANNIFVYFKSADNSVNVTSLLRNNVSVPIATDGNGNPIYFNGKPVFALGNIIGTNSVSLIDEEINLQLQAHIDCSNNQSLTDTLTAVFGWNCFHYPIIPSQACFVDSTDFIINLPVTGMTNNVTFADNIGPCDTLWTTVQINATGIGDLNHIQVNLPQTSYYTCVASTANYHNNSYPLNPQMIGQQYVWNFDQLNLTHFEQDSIYLLIGLIPACHYPHDSTITFFFTANNTCGSLLSDSIVKLPVINNTINRDSLSVYTQATVYNNCGGNSTITFIIKNDGQNITSSDFFNVYLPVPFAYSGGYPYNQYTSQQYQFIINSLNPGDSLVISFNLITTSIVTSGNYNGYMFFSDNLTCGSQNCLIAWDTTAFSIQVIQTQLSLSLSSNAPVCEGNELHLSAQGGTSYQWTGPDGFFSSDQNPVVSSFASQNVGYYFVTVTDANGCTGKDSLFAQPITTPNTDFSIVSCPVINNLVQFNALDQTADTWLWTFDQNTHTSSGMQVLHGFNQDGYHCITLAATNQCGTSTTSRNMYVYPNKCVCEINYDFDNYTIPTNSLWDNTTYPTGIFLKGDIRIPSGVTLELSNVNVYCAPDVRIIVEPKAYLYLHDNVNIAGLPSPCSYMWQGIEVWGDGYDTLLSSQGLIKCRNRNSISEAHIAIMLGARNIEYICGDTSLYNTSLSGGFAKITQTSFGDNGYGIMIIATPIRRYQSTSYSNNQFFCNTILSDHRYNSHQINHYPTAYNPWINSNNTGITQAGIWATDAHFQSINNCTFNKIKYAIQLYDTRNDVYNCSFTNNTYGIYIQNYLSAIDSRHEISQCTFDKIPGIANTFGAAIYIRAGRYDFIHDNIFGVDELFPQSNNNNALYTNNSKSFNISQNIFFNFITGVNIINSGAYGGYVGAWNTGITNTLPEWEGNHFTACKTHIITSGNNTALRLKCNNCYNNVANLYTVNFNNYGQLANQGSMPPNFGSSAFKQKFAAGNAFYSTIAVGEKIVSQTSSYRYYHHSAPPEVIPDVSTSPFPINLNSINIPKTSTHVACPPPTIIINSTTLNADYAAVNNKLDSLQQAEETLKNNLATLNTTLDKGKTTELLNDIYGNTSNGQLKNKLISNSLLSDTVLIALQVENPLSAGNYKNVMEKNLPVSKKVEPYFNERLKTLPTGIANQLRSLQADNPLVVTPASLQNQIDYTYMERQLLLNQLIITLNDSLNNRKQDAIALLEQENTNESRQILASTYIADGNYTLALNKLNAIDDPNPEMQEWKELTLLLLNLYQEGKTLYQLDTNQLNYIRELAVQCPTTLATANAQAILSLLYNEEYPECPNEILNKTKPLMKPNTHIEIQAYLGDNYPEPFNSETVIPYYLPQNQQGTIAVYNILGIKLCEYKLTEGENQLEINTSDWQQGVYMYTLYVNNEPVETKQMILVK